MQNFLQHKVVLHDHQIMKSIIILKINDISKFAVHWVDGKNLQCSHALGLQIGFLVAMEKRAVSYTTSIILSTFSSGHIPCTRMFDILVTMLMFAMSKNYLD